MDVFDNIIKTMFRFDVLNTLPRTGFLIRGIPNPETVGEHVFSTSVLAIFICDELKKSGMQFNSEEVLRTVILHEAGEVIIGDIPAPAKRLMGKNVKNNIELKAAKRVLENFPESSRLIEKYEQKDGLESKIVKTLDKLQMMIKVLIYESNGQGRLDDFWEFNSNFNDFGISFFKKLFDRIKEMRFKDIRLDYLDISEATDY